MNKLIEQIAQKQEFGLSVEPNMLILTRGQFACTCPISNRFNAPQIDPITKQSRLVPDYPLCTSSCPAFEVSEIKTDHEGNLKTARFRCKSIQSFEDIPGHRITAPEAANSPLTKL